MGDAYEAMDATSRRPMTVRSEAEIRAELAAHVTWMDENEGQGASEEGVEIGWGQALKWVLRE